MLESNSLHIRFSVGSLSISIRELAKNVKVADLLAEIELKSAVPAQLLELLNPGMEIIPVSGELEFGRELKNGALLTASVHPGWAQIVDQGVLARWSEVLSISQSMGPEATEICTFLVVKYGSLDDLRKLIERGAAVSGRTLFERSTLHFAAYHGRTEFIHLLLGAGVGAGHKDYQGLTAKEYATKNGFYETARWCWLGQFNYGRHGGVMMPKEDKKTSAGSNRSEKKPKMKEKVKSAPVKSSQLPTQKSRKMVVNWLRESSEAIPDVEKTESVAKSDFVRGKNYERPSSTSRPRSSSKEQKTPKRVQLLAPTGAGEGSTEYRKTRFSRERPPELDEAVRRSQNNHLTVDPAPSRVRFPEENDEPEKTKKNFRKTKFSLNRPDGLDDLVKSVDRTPEPKLSKGVCFASEDESEDERPEKSKFRKTKFSRNRPEGLDQLVEKTEKIDEPQVREEKGVSFMSEEQEEDQEKIKFRKTKFSLSRPEGIDEIVQNTQSEDPFFLTQNDDLSDSDSETKKHRSISFADDEEDDNRYHRKYRKSVFVSSSSFKESDEEKTLSHELQSEEDRINFNLLKVHDDKDDDDAFSSQKPKITIAEKPPSPQISIPTTPADSVDQFIKLESDKIKSNEIKEENSEPEVTFTEERFQQKEFTLPDSETREKTPEPKTELSNPEVSFRVSITPAAGESKLLDQRPSIPPTTLQANNRQQRPTSSITSNVPRPRPKLVQRAKTSHDLLEQERQKKEAEEKRRAEAEAAYQQWVKAKKNVKLRRLTPSPPPERDLKWYENKKRMFEPGSYSERPRAKIQPNSAQNSRPTPIYSEAHKPRRYDGNGIAFEEWLARKQNEQRSSNPNQQESQEETKKKNDEMRQMMAEEKFKEWLNKKLEQRQKATAQENQDRYEAHKRNTTSENQLSFDAWLEKKNDQQKQLQRVLRQIKREEQKRAEEERERKQQGLSFEDWMIRKEQAELYGDKVARDLAQQDAAAKLAEIEGKKRMRSQQELEENQDEETGYEDSKIEETEEREMLESPKEEVLESTSNSPEIPSNEKSPEASETLISSPNSPKIPDSKPEPSFEPEPASEPVGEPEPEAVVIIHEVSMGKTTEILENGEQRVSTSQQEDKFIETLVENQIEDAQPFDPQDPFVDDYDSDHTSLASDISYPELLDLITNLDSD